MYCAKCGAFIQEGDQFCIKCGAPAPSGARVSTPAPAAAPPSTPGQWPAQPVAPPAPAWSAAPPAPSGVMGPGNPVMNMGAIIFVVLGIIASIVATGLSWDEAYEWAAGIYLLSAFLFIFAGIFFYLAKRSRSSPQ